MREYEDDNIRLYTPVLQRVIILAAVIIAVPVVMWTITTFVRTYVASPKAPIYQHMAAAEPQNNAPAALPPLPSAPQATAPQGMQASSSPAPQPSASMASAAAMASDARTALLEIKKPPAGGNSTASDANAAVAPQAAAPQAAAPKPRCQHRRSRCQPSRRSPRRPFLHRPA